MLEIVFELLQISFVVAWVLHSRPPAREKTNRINLKGGAKIDGYQTLKHLITQQLKVDE